MSSPLRTIESNHGYCQKHSPLTLQAKEACSGKHRVGKAFKNDEVLEVASELSDL